MADLGQSGARPKFRLRVGFNVDPIDIVFEADSIEDAWARRREVMEGVEPEAIEAYPYSVEAVDD